MTDHEKEIQELRRELARVKAERDAAIADIELVIHGDHMDVCDLCDCNPHGARCPKTCAEAHWRGVQNA